MPDLSQTIAAPRRALLWRAAMYMVVASFLFATMNALAKYVLITPAGAVIGALQVTFCRYLSGTLFLLPVLFWDKVVPRTRHPGKYALRAGFGASSVVLMILAFQFIPLANATAIGFSSPIFTMMLTVLFLGERAGWRRWLAALIGFTGVIAIAGPDGNILNTGSLIAVAAALCMGAEMAALKWVARLGDRPIVMLFMGNILGAILVAAFALPQWTWPEPWQWFPLAGTGLVAIVGQRLTLTAMRSADANVIAPLLYATMIFSGLYGVLLFGEVPGWGLYVGMGLIISSGVMLARSGR
ncbi:MAG: DMT family transporter [Alphaproteobacteria bacterium]|nr:DMT family transporter [Alphaproteobacteria bacterium]